MTKDFDPCRRVASFFDGDGPAHGDPSTTFDEVRRHVASCAACDRTLAADLAVVAALVRPPAAIAPAWRGIAVAKAFQHARAFSRRAAAVLIVCGLAGAGGAAYFASRNVTPAEATPGRSSPIELSARPPAAEAPAIEFTEFVETTVAQSSRGELVTRRSYAAVVRDETGGALR